MHVEMDGDERMDERVALMDGWSNRRTLQAQRKLLRQMRAKKLSTCGYVTDEERISRRDSRSSARSNRELDVWGGRKVFHSTYKTVIHSQERLQTHRCLFGYGIPYHPSIWSPMVPTFWTTWVGRVVARKIHLSQANLQPIMSRVSQQHV